MSRDEKKKSDEDDDDDDDAAVGNGGFDDGKNDDDDDGDDNDEPILVAAVEGGGTSFVVAVAQIHITNGKATTMTMTTTTTTKPPTILHRAEFDSSHDDPSRTLEECASFLRSHKPPGGYRALSLANFGPLGVNPNDDTTYGTVLGSSPKRAWRNVDLLTPLRGAASASPDDRSRRLPLPVMVETDVNAPALAEFEQHNREASAAAAAAGRDGKAPITSLAYVTVGTGVGVGLLVNGRCVHGRMHPEGGHVAVRPLPNDAFGGYSWGSHSPYYGKGTVEGLASSVALTERLEQRRRLEEEDGLGAGGDPQPAQESPPPSSSSLSRTVLAELHDDDDVWDHAANAIANLCVTLLLTVSIEQIVLGGGIMKRNGLLEKVQSRTVHLMNGYVDLPPVGEMSALIRKSSHGDRAGLVGAVFLAQRAYLDHLEKTKDGRDVGDGTTKHERRAFRWGVLHGAVLGGAAAAIAFASLLWLGGKGRSRSGP